MHVAIMLNKRMKTVKKVLCTNGKLRFEDRQFYVLSENTISLDFHVQLQSTKWKNYNVQFKVSVKKNEKEISTSRERFMQYVTKVILSDIF